jgi:hypothetical protein
MVPDLAQRLQSMTRALNEVVIPAIDPSQKLALEQAHLVVAYLGLLSDQHDKVYEYELADLREARSLVVRLLASTRDVEHIDLVRRSAEHWLRESEWIGSLDIPSQARVVALAREIKGAADALVRALYEDGGAETRKAVAEAVMDQAGRQIRRDRVWARRAGFEIESDELPELEEVLSDGNGSDKQS